MIDRYRSATTTPGWMILRFLMARRLQVPASAALGPSPELLALAAIRDNLTLNVLMLVRPVDAIRIWQAG